MSELETNGQTTSSQQRLDAYIAEHGAERIVLWIESHRRQLARASQPENREKAREAAKRRREEQVAEIETLRQEIAKLRALQGGQAQPARQ